MSQRKLRALARGPRRGRHQRARGRGPARTRGRGAARAQAQHGAAVPRGKRGQRRRARRQRRQHARGARFGAKLQVADEHAVHDRAGRQAVAALRSIIGLG